MSIEEAGEERQRRDIYESWGWEERASVGLGRVGNPQEVYAKIRCASNSICMME
jgi:hypothetical protein